MKNIGVFVGEEKWLFFNEIYEALNARYKTDVFSHKDIRNIPLVHGKVNQWVYRNKIHAILNRNEVCFFEWAGDLLAVASYMPKKCAIVTRLHSFELFTWASKINWNTIDKIILVSKAMQKSFIDLYPNCANRTTVICNGRSLEKFMPSIDKAFCFELGMLGHIAPIKRVYEVVLMFHSLIQGGYDARLHLAGEPDDDYRYAVAVHRLVDRLGLQERVLFYGQVKDPSSWLKKIDIFITNSYWEGQQVALLEAMASGCYCLSHCWSGAEEMLPESNLYYTEGELSKKILDYFETSDLEKLEQKKRMRAWAEKNFDINQTIEQVVQAIEDVTETALVAK